jgi:alkanesulfonate monooxygenase SsuD/methylene tetrahydromethanopterin reductase-like flavin-dependent oxidoreductase (luciferase family)
MPARSPAWAALRPTVPCPAASSGGLEREGGPDARHHRDPGDIAGEARHAERLGFDLAAAGEHVFFHGPVGNAFVTLAAAAAVTAVSRS